jgi:cobalt-zinc-cadmium efflux system membrane fusion protein
VRRRHTLAFAALLLLAGSLACAREDRAGDEYADAPFEQGPHGGRWLEDGDFALELALAEAGALPELRAYAFEDEEPIEPSRVSLDVTLRRLGGRAERIAFEPRGDRLVGVPAVGEPHSFDVEVVARVGGSEHRFAYASYESRVSLDADQLEVAGIELLTAGPATIRERVVLNGRIAPNEDALAHVMPRFPGLVRSVHKRLGDPVVAGDLLAVIESNESLHPYELRSRIGGRVIEKNVAPGEIASTDRELFAIADLSTVWADLDVYRRDVGRLRVAQPVRVDAGDGSPPGETQLAYLSPIGSVDTQTLLARAVLPNPDGAWRPGLFVTAEVEVGVFEVPVAVSDAAIQRLDGEDVVFVSDGTAFEARPVELGRRDGAHVEIVSGLFAGQRYVGAGSFVIKAEIGKSGAGHDH